MKNNRKNNNVMVCVTGQRSCDRLLSRGTERAASLNGQSNVHMVHCVETGRNFLNTPYESEAIEYLFTAAQLAGADLSLLRADDIVAAIVEYAKEHGVGLIVLGTPPTHDNATPLHIRLQRQLPDVEFDVVAAE